MKVLQCSNGHFFDVDTYETCPHCGAEVKSDSAPKKEKSHSFFKIGKGKTEESKLEFSKSENSKSDGKLNFKKDEKSQEVSPENSDGYYSEVTEVSNNSFGSAIAGNSYVDSEDEITEVGDSFRVDDADIEVTEVLNFSGFGSAPVTRNANPPVGWLVCISGMYFGNTYPIKAGKNSVGRDSSNMIAIIGDPTVSNLKHLWITYEPRKREFFIQPGESSGLVYLNGENVMDVRQINAYDKLEIGAGIYILVPLCGEQFAWEEVID